MPLRGTTGSPTVARALIVPASSDREAVSAVPARNGSMVHLRSRRRCTRCCVSPLRHCRGLRRIVAVLKIAGFVADLPWRLAQLTTRTRRRGMPERIERTPSVCGVDTRLPDQMLCSLTGFDRTSRRTRCRMPQTRIRLTSRICCGRPEAGRVTVEPASRRSRWLTRGRPRGGWLPPVCATTVGSGSSVLAPSCVLAVPARARLIRGSVRCSLRWSRSGCWWWNLPSHWRFTD